MIPALRKATAWARRAAGTWLFERRYGVHTAGRVDLEQLGLAHVDRVYYIASNWRNLRRALRKQSISKSDVFLDLGSGMGRMVLEAARFPFGRVIGVELSEDLHRIAQQNLRTYRLPLRCTDVELVNCDVQQYRIPDDVTVVYMFNPFRGAIFAAVVAELIRSVDEAPRPLRVVYANPLEEEQLLATGRFRLVDDVAKGQQRSAGPARSIRTYLVDPAPAAVPARSNTTEERA